MVTCETIKNTGMGVRDVVSITQFLRVIEAAEVMSENHVGSLVVVADDNDDTMVGIVTERDILKWISRASPETYFQNARAIMTRDVVFCNAKTSLAEARKIMKDNAIRHLPIVTKGVAVGMISARDLLRPVD